ncbi:MAG: iron-sulfur cluster assembly scaffold protein [Anaerolineae bacterium]|nr:iron-sulfur cluster assembly scaffold protein [Anaerolineae bacterium]
MFDRQAFIELITDHVESPRHYGRMADATVSMTYGNPGCGDLITVFLKLDENERVTDVSFVDENPTHDNPNQSCSVSRGATSILTEMVIGKTLEEIAALDSQEFVDEIGGHSVAATRPKCITLGVSAMKAAEKRYRFQQQQEQNQQNG